MGKTISICNQKGGTGKTTTSVNLSHALACLNKKVLLIDTDPQGNASSGVGVNKSVIDKSVYDVLVGKCNVQDAILENVFKNLDVIPCNINLTGAEIELVGALARETRLKKALSLIKDKYDFIFIDSPPSLGLLTLNALVASDSIIIPIQCEFYALEGVSQLLHTINLIREGLNQALTIEGVLLTMADFRTNLTTEVINEIRGYFKEKVYKTIIPRNIKLSEAPSFGKPILLYDNNSIGAKKYNEFALELLGEKIPNTLQQNDLQNNQDSEVRRNETPIM
jgi:chromosome partitioning protein